MDEDFDNLNVYFSQIRNANISKPKRKLHSVNKNESIYYTTKNNAGLMYSKGRPTVPYIIQSRQIGFPAKYINPLSSRKKCLLKSLEFNHADSDLSNIIDLYHRKAFNSVFSNDGKMLVTTAQDHVIRIYDSSIKFFGKSEKYNTGKIEIPKYIIDAPDIHYSIVDIKWSEDNNSIYYSTWGSVVYEIDVTSLDNHSDCIFSSVKLHETNFNAFSTCFFSIAVTGDNRYICGGSTKGNAFILDKEARNVIKFRAHEDDVNGVAFTEKNSKILITASDDGIIKLWDLRTVDNSRQVEVSALYGHGCGIVYVDSRMDGRYLITNSKDQSIKLWDIRKVATSKPYNKKFNLSRYWDYRLQKVPKNYKRRNNFGDISIATYKGHRVLQSLIRCKFSPESTGQRYIYTGSENCSFIVYDLLSAKQLKICGGHEQLVRDVSWHPDRMQIISASWDGKIRSSLQDVEDENSSPS